MSKEKNPRAIQVTVPVKRVLSENKDNKDIAWEGLTTIKIPFRIRFATALIVAYDKLNLIEGITPEQVEEGKEIIGEILSKIGGEIKDIRIRPRSNELKVITKSLKAEEINRLFKNIVIERVVEGLLLELKPRGEKEKLHKQPRTLLKTVAKVMSNTAEPTLFSIQEKPEQGEVLGDAIKEEISKNTAGLAYYLIQLYQENNSRDKKKELVIENLTPIAEKLGCTNHRLKLYLLYLGGYIYPIVDKDEHTKELVLANEQLFNIEFRYSEKVAEKYSIGPTGKLEGAERYGTDILTFIKDEPLERVIVKPSERFIKAIEGKGLGNILTVNNRFLELILEVSPIAVKILSYSSSNQPKQKIGEDKLVTHLGLTRQVKVQGKPRVRATILKGFQELQGKGHIKEYSYEASTGAYTYTYSDMYVKFKEGRRGKRALGEASGEG